jgi:hypothetical protein
MFHFIKNVNNECLLPPSKYFFVHTQEIFNITISRKSTHIYYKSIYVDLKQPHSTVMYRNYQPISGSLPSHKKHILPNAIIVKCSLRLLLTNKCDNYDTVLPGHFTNHKCIYSQVAAKATMTMISCEIFQFGLINTFILMGGGIKNDRLPPRNQLCGTTAQKSLIPIMKKPSLKKPTTPLLLGLSKSCWLKHITGPYIIYELICLHSIHHGFPL